MNNYFKNIIQKPNLKSSNNLISVHDEEIHFKTSTGEEAKLFFGFKTEEGFIARTTYNNSKPYGFIFTDNKAKWFGDRRVFPMGLVREVEVFLQWKLKLLLEPEFLSSFDIKFSFE